MIVAAIDPGPTESALVAFDLELSRPMMYGVTDNLALRHQLKGLRGASNCHRLLIEYTPPYALSTRAGGSFVPAQVVTTAIEIGRFIEAFDGPHELVSRLDVKKHLLGKTNGNDAMVAAALFERYGGNIKAAKGTKANPGPLHGFSSHLYAALAVAVTYCEKRELARA